MPEPVDAGEDDEVLDTELTSGRTFTTLANLLIAGDGTDGSQEEPATTTTEPAPSGSRSPDDETRLIWMVIVGLGGLALLAALLTWRYWLLTRPGMNFDDEDDVDGNPGPGDDPYDYDGGWGPHDGWGEPTQAGTMAGGSGMQPGRQPDPRRAGMTADGPAQHAMDATQAGMMTGVPGGAMTEYGGWPPRGAPDADGPEPGQHAGWSAEPERAAGAAPPRRPRRGEGDGGPTRGDRTRAAAPWAEPRRGRPDGADGPPPRRRPPDPWSRPPPAGDGGAPPRRRRPPEGLEGPPPRARRTGPPPRPQRPPESPPPEGGRRPPRRDATGPPPRRRAAPPDPETAGWWDAPDGNGAHDPYGARQQEEDFWTRRSRRR